MKRLRDLIRGRGKRAPLLPLHRASDDIPLDRVSSVPILETTSASDNMIARDTEQRNFVEIRLTDKVKLSDISFQIGAGNSITHSIIISQ
jgi:hypothetical protein